MMLEALLEANSVRDLQTALRAITRRYWQAKSCFYFTYSESSQTLSYGLESWGLQEGHQFCECAKVLAAVKNQDLSWPEGLATDSEFRLSLPIFEWGSLNAVLCLGFDKEPDELRGRDELEKSLGHLGGRVLEREQGLQFTNRCQEIFVQAVEAQSQDGHVKRCCRLVQALGSMLDCSPQIQSDLFEAAQYHDVGMLVFPDRCSQEALREHSMIGANLLRLHPGLQGVAPLVEAHHERYDGSGQPYGKSGDELALEVWILSLTEDLVEYWERSDKGYEGKVSEFTTH